MTARDTTHDSNRTHTTEHRDASITLEDGGCNVSTLEAWVRTDGEASVPEVVA